MDCSVNPFELGLNRLVDLEMDADFIGKDALKKIKSEGVKRRQVGLEISCSPLQHPNTNYWPIFMDSHEVGYITSAVYSPRLDKNIALAIMDVECSAIDTTGEVNTPEGNYPIKVVQKPFYDPKKKITSGSLADQT
jgi:aminomethyltransferase